MNRLFQHFKVLLADKYVSTFILAVCIMFKSVLIFFYSYTGWDKMNHLSASYNLLHGKGWTNSFYYTDQLDKEVLEPFCLWPPGYGLMVTPVEYFTKNNLLLGANIVEVFSFIALILLCRGILKAQGVNKLWISISTILLSFYSNESIEKSLGTDLPGLVFMLGFFYCALRLWRLNSRHVSIWLGIAGGLCLFMAGFTRYMYIPVALFGAAFMLIVAYWKNNKLSLKGYWVCLTVCAAGLGIASLYQASVCTDPVYVGIDKRGIFLKNWEYWHPATLAAFLDVNVYPTFLERITSIPYVLWKKLFGWINIAVYVCLLVNAVRFIPTVKKSKTNDFPVFEVLGFLLSVAIIGELAMLSLTYSAKYKFSGNSWTFITEGRYQAFAVTFLQLFILSKIAKTGVWFRRRDIREYAILALFALMCLNSLHQVYFSTKVAFDFRDQKNSLQRDKDYVFVESYLLQAMRDNPGKEVLVTSVDRYFPLMASVHGAKGVKDEYNINKISSVVTKPSILITVITPEQLEQYRPFTERKDVKLLNIVNHMYIYRQDIFP